MDDGVWVQPKFTSIDDPATCLVFDACVKFNVETTHAFSSALCLLMDSSLASIVTVVMIAGIDVYLNRFVLPLVRWRYFRGIWLNFGEMPL